jgi:outer membrane lipoprotein-sorting protein
VIHLLIFILLSNLIAQVKDKSLTSIFPTADSVLDSLEQNYNRIEDYYTRIVISIKTPILRMPKKSIDFWFKQPNLTKVETKGFAAIPKSGMISSPIDLFDNLSNISVIGAEYYKDKQVWILHGNLNPDSLMFSNIGSIDKKLDLSMKLWIDRNIWTLIKSETWMDTVKVVEISSIYKSVRDNIYLPKETVIKFQYSGGLPSGVEKTFGEKHQFGRMQDDSSEKDLSGMITLIFSDYKVNKGIEDTFFEEDEPKNLQD